MIEIRIWRKILRRAWLLDDHIVCVAPYRARHNAASRLTVTRVRGRNCLLQHRRVRYATFFSLLQTWYNQVFLIFLMLHTFNNFVTKGCPFCNENAREMLRRLPGRLPQVCVFHGFQCCISYFQMYRTPINFVETTDAICCNVCYRLCVFSDFSMMFTC